MSWLSDKFDEFTAQINPFDHGKTAATVRAARPKPQPAQTISRPQQSQAPPQNQRWSFGRAFHDITHNPLTDVVGKVARPATRFVTNDVVKPSYNYLSGGGTIGQHVPTYRRFSQGLTHGIERSLTGTGQALSGLYDLATPGTGTNRVSKGLNNLSQTIDTTAKQQHVNPVVYHGAQALGDVAQFAIGSGEAKLVANAAANAPRVGKVVAPILDVAPRVENTVARATGRLSSGDFGQRVAARALRSAVNPAYQGVNAAFTATQIGKDASQGKDISPAGVTTNLVAGGVGLPVGGALLREGADPLVQRATRALQDAHFMRPSPLTDSELANIQNMRNISGTGAAIGQDQVFNDAYESLARAGVNPYDTVAIDRLIGSHVTHNSIVQQREQKLAEVLAKAQKFSQDHPIGMSTRAVDENGQPISGLTGRPLLPSNVNPDAEAMVFAENPMATTQMRRQGLGANQLENHSQISVSQEPLLSPKTARASDSSASSLPEYNTKKVSNIDKAFRSTRSIIERQGESGKKLAGMLQGSRDTQEIYLSQLQKQLPTVRKLKDKAFEDFVEATQGHIAPPNAKIAQAVREWQSVHPSIRERAVNAGLDVGDLGPNYYPHFIDFDAVFKDKNKYNAAINHLVKTGQAPDAEAAIKLLGYARDISRNRQFGNLEASRVIDIPFYDKTPNSLVGYLNGSAKRIAQTETFGKQDENALKLIHQIGIEGGDTEAAKNAYDIAVGAKQYNPTASRVSGNIRKYVTTTRLGLGALTNVSQNVNTGIVTGHLRTLGAAIKQLSPKTRSFVGDTGVIADAVLNDLKTQAGYESFGKKAAGKVVDKITAPLFGTVEKLNRSIAATSGRDYGLRLAQKGDERTLRRLGVTGEIKNKTLTPEQQIQVARKVVEKTQFKVDPQDLPGWADSPGGKLVSQFRTFSYSQGKFVSNEILKPAMKGNLLPLGRLLAALPVGYALYETKRAIAGRPEEENKTKVGLQAFQNVGGAGLAFDLYQSLNPIGSKYLPPDRRTSMAVGAVGGPAAGVAAQGVGAVSEAAQRKNTPTDESRLDGKLVAGKNSNDYTDLTSLARFGLQQIPIVGTPIKNRLLPFTTESNADAGKSNNKSISAINKKTVENNKKFRSSFSKDDYALYTLNKNERKQAVSEGLVSQKKLDNLDRYAASTKAKLGLSKPKTDKSSSPDAEYKAFKKEYDDKIKNGEYNSAEKIKADKKLAKLEVGAKYTKSTRDLYSLSKSDLSDYLAKKEKGVDKATIAKRLIEYDQRLHDAGIISYRKFKNGIAPSSGSKKGGRGGKKKSSFNYKLFGYGSPATSVNKSLRKLLEDLVVSA